jgi:hypothetical protein
MFRNLKFGGFSESHCIHCRGLGKDNREYGMVSNCAISPLFFILVVANHNMGCNS